MIAPANGLWDYLLVAGKRSPGVVKVSGDGIKVGWDIQQATATTGGVTRRTGEPIKEFDAEFYLTDEPNALGVTDFDRWDDFQKILEASVAPGKKPYALDVSHPDLARVRITSATVGSIGTVALDGKGGGTIKVHFLEYRPPKPIGSVTLTKTAGDAKIEAALAQIDKLNKEWDNPGGTGTQNNWSGGWGAK